MNLRACWRPSNVVTTRLWRLPADTEGRPTLRHPSPLRSSSVYPPTPSQLGDRETQTQHSSSSFAAEKYFHFQQKSLSQKLEPFILPSQFLRRPNLTSPRIHRTPDSCAPWVSRSRSSSPNSLARGTCVYLWSVLTPLVKPQFCTSWSWAKSWQQSRPLVGRFRGSSWQTGFLVSVKLRWRFTSSGFNVETVEYKNISFTVWDVGGQDKVRCTSYARTWC